MRAPAGHPGARIEAGLRRARSGAAVGFVALAFVALAASAAPTDRLGVDDARHLLARTGFGPTASDVAAFAPLTRAEGVDRLLRETRTQAVTPPPAAMTAPGPFAPPRGEDATAEERSAFRRQQVREGLELRAWWLREMLATPSPLTERMTLFWHNHFVSGQQKVRIARLMYRQNVTLRAHALGNFAALLHAAAKDPAMVIYLDAVRNRRGQPNENFAREVMELFTLGEGRYGERDVREAARAFTGWSLDRDSGVFVDRPLLHDPGTKTVLGRTGPLDGDDVLAILLAQPATAETIVRRLWREFVSPDPDPVEVSRIAAAFRTSGYEIKVALRALLLSDAFYASGARGVLVKSPVELVVGTLRQLDQSPDDTLPFALTATAMGQNLFSPPNVKGWPGGDAWIDTRTLLVRKQFLERVARTDVALTRATALPATATMAGGEEEAVPQAIAAADDDAPLRARRVARAMDRGMRALHVDSSAWIAAMPGPTSARKREWAIGILLPIAPQATIPDGAKSAELLHAALLDPAFELK